MKKKDTQKLGKIEVLPEQDSGAKDTSNPDSSTPLPVEAWEKMYHALNDYRLGHIDFLSLLDKYEEILQIKKHA
jgi:hypothetical protein